LPASAADLDVLEDCIASGISATATVSFTVPQVIAIAERCRAGRLRATPTGVNPGECFAVKAYEPDGMQPSEFIAYGAAQRTLGQYSKAGWKLLGNFR
jgi:hypothetical protein